MPQVGLFVPCYIDQLYPDVAWATVELLERFGCTIEYPADQTCCGQPMANTGCATETAPLVRRFLKLFGDFEYVVCPSGSCAAMVRLHYHDYLGNDPAYERLQGRVFELTEFLVDVLKVDCIGGRFPHRVGLHQSCHGLRELRLASSSERVGPTYNKARRLLETIDGITLVDLQRPDECCGFGGAFAVSEESVSCMMGLDRVQDHEQAGTEVLTANDMSCLMHLHGILRRKKTPIQVMHLAQILAGRSADINS